MSNLITKDSKHYNQVYSITKRYLKELRKILKGNQEEYPRIKRVIIVDYIDDVTVYPEI